jgi:tetratricopeptide (TPR) repeat protein
MVWLPRGVVAALPATLVAPALLAALLGGVFWVRALAGVLPQLDCVVAAGASPLAAAGGVARLVVQGLLCEQGSRVGFVHALVRAAVDRSVPEAVRQPVHHAALRFYRDGAELPGLERLARLARHAAGAGLRAEALAYYLALAERARERHEYLDAEALYGAALAQTTDAEAAAQVAALRGRGLMRYRLSRYDDALADLERARRLAEARGDAPAVCELLLDAATALDWSDEYRRSRELVEQAAAIAATAGSSAQVEARLLPGLGRSAFRFDRHAEAAALLERAAANAARLGDAGYETLVIADLLRGYILAELGRLDESAQVFDRVIPLCEARGDQLHLGAALGNRSMLWIARNDRDRLLADLQRLLDIARELGNGRMEQQAHFYLGLFLHWLGEPRPAAQHARWAVEIDERRYGQTARPEALLLLARVAAGAGDTAAARAILGDIRRRQQRAHQRGDRELALLPAEQVLCSMIDLIVRSGTEAEWAELVPRARAQLSGPDRIEFFLMRGLAAARESQPGRAREALAEAHRIAAAVPNVMKTRIEDMLNHLPPT